MGLEPGGDPHAGLAVPGHSKGEGLHAAQGEVRVEGTHDRADRVLQVADAFGQFGGADHEGAADHVGVTTEVLGDRVEDDVRTEFERPLERGRREGVVDHGEGAVSGGDLRDRGDVRDLQGRVGRSLEPDHRGSGVGPEFGEGRFDVRRVGGVDVLDVEPLGPGPDPGEQPIGPAVEVVTRDHGSTGIEQFETGARRRESGGEGEAAV